MQPTLEFVKNISRQAGQILQSFVGKEMDVRHKSRTDLVTKADHASERFLIDAVRAEFPDHAVNAEESGELAGSQAHQWFIDPLDGTLNFAHGVPFYCVSVGYAFQGEMALGVIYDPVRDEMFCARRGKGATLNGKPIQVSGFTDLIDCMLVTGFPYDHEHAPDDNNENFIRFNQLSQTVRRLGSAALNVAYVGAGRLDGFWEVTIRPWDVAAAGLIVREAGGAATNVYGDPNFMAEPISLVCANPIIHAKMLDALADVRGARDPVISSSV